MTDHAALAEFIERERGLHPGAASEDAAAIVAAVNEGRLAPIVPDECEWAGEQIERLAAFIIENIPGEPSRSEGAVEVAIRLLAELASLRALKAKVDGIGDLDPYTATVPDLLALLAWLREPTDG